MSPIFFCSTSCMLSPAPIQSNKFSNFWLCALCSFKKFSHAEVHCFRSSAEADGCTSIPENNVEGEMVNALFLHRDREPLRQETCSAAPSSQDGHQLSCAETERSLVEVKPTIPTFSFTLSSCKSFAFSPWWILVIPCPNDCGIWVSLWKRDTLQWGEEAPSIITCVH